jgi:CheY-like chemotaxis protein
MKILIIEDDQNKIKQISEYVKTIMPDNKICEKRSYQSGLKEIQNGNYDVVLLDMSMPTFDISPQETGGRPRQFAGKEILMQMKRKKLKTSVIVVTQFERFGENNGITLSQLKEELKGIYEGVYVGTVYYNAALNNWKEELKDMLFKIQYREKGV